MTHLHTTNSQLSDSLTDRYLQVNLLVQHKLKFSQFLHLKTYTMAPTDPHQGGRLEDMAAEGITIPGDADQQ